MAKDKIARGQLSAYKTENATISPQRIVSQFNAFAVDSIVTGQYVTGYDATTLLPVYGASESYCTFQLDITPYKTLKIYLESLDLWGFALSIWDTNTKTVTPLRYGKASIINGTTVDQITYVNGDNYFTIDVESLLLLYPDAKYAILNIKVANLGNEFIYSTFEELRQVAMILPDRITCVAGHEVALYYDNVLLYGRLQAMQTMYMAKFVAGKQYPDKWVWQPTVATTNVRNIMMAPYGSLVPVENKAVNCVCVAPDVGSGTRNVIAIGDSKIGAGVITQSLIDLFATDTITLNLLGSRGTAPNLHEGRPSWTAKDYCIGETFNAITNAFYNPTTSQFDFAYYMTQRGYTSVDYVFIDLGTNDVSRIPNVGEPTEAQIIGYYQQMIDSIHAYNGDIKVIVGMCEGICQREFDYSATSYNFRDMHKLHLQALLDAFKGRETSKIYLCPLYINIDPLNDYNLQEIPLSAHDTATMTVPIDRVHQSDVGYKKNADMVYFMIKYIESLAV